MKTLVKLIDYFGRLARMKADYPKEYVSLFYAGLLLGALAFGWVILIIKIF